MWYFVAVFSREAKWWIMFGCLVPRKREKSEKRGCLRKAEVKWGKSYEQLKVENLLFWGVGLRLLVIYGGVLERESERDTETDRDTQLGVPGERIRERASNCSSLAASLTECICKRKRPSCLANTQYNSSLLSTNFAREVCIAPRESVVSLIDLCC